MNKKIIGLMVAVVIIGVIYGVSINNSSQEKDEAIKIGGLFGLTDFVAFAGETSRNGFLMAIEDSGMDIDYVIEDFQSDLKTTVTAATKLVDIDGVDVIVGPEWAEFSEVIIPLAKKTKTVFISPWMTAEEDWMKTGYYFTATPSERDHVKKILSHMRDTGMTKVGLMYSNNAWALGLSKTVKEELLNYPEIQVVFESKSNEDETDYRTDLLKLRDSGADTLYALMSAGQGANTITRQYTELDIKTTMYMPFSTASQIQASGNEGKFADGIIFPTTKDSELTAEFIVKYTKRFGFEPSAITGATSYDMTTLVLNAIKEGAETSDEIGNYLSKVKGYKGYSNIIEFDRNGQVILDAESIELREIQGDSAILVDY